MLGLQSRVAQQQCSSSAHRQQRHAHRRLPLSKPLHASLDSKPELKRPAPAPPAPQQPEAAAAAPAGSAAAAPEAPRPAPTVAAGGKTSTTTIEYQRQQVCWVLGGPLACMCVCAGPSRPLYKAACAPAAPTTALPHTSTAQQHTGKGNGSVLYR